MLGALREAAEETGLQVVLERYLVRIHVTFHDGAVEEPWVSHLFLARTLQTDLAPQDRAEIAGARWATTGELAGPVREALVRSGGGLFRYRAHLHDAGLAALNGGRFPHLET